MSSTKINATQAVQILRSVIGEYAWFVRCGPDRILRLDFGAPHLTVREPSPVSHGSEAFRAALGRRVVVPAGKWHLFVEDGLWSIEAGGKQCARLDHDTTDLDGCLNQLDGQKLAAIDFEAATQTWIFRFDLSGVLRIAQSPDGPDDAWIVFFGEGGHLSCRTPQDISLDRA